MTLIKPHVFLRSPIWSTLFAYMPHPNNTRLMLGKCHLLIIFANMYDPNKVRQTVAPDLDPICLHSDGIDNPFSGILSGLHYLPSPPPPSLKKRKKKDTTRVIFYVHRIYSTTHRTNTNLVVNLTLNPSPQQQLFIYVNALQNFKMNCYTVRSLGNMKL